MFFAEYGARGGTGTGLESHAGGVGGRGGEDPRFEHSAPTSICRGQRLRDAEVKELHNFPCSIETTMISRSRGSIKRDDVRST